MTKPIIPWNDESRMRYRAARRGYVVVQTRGKEHKRREKAGAGTYLLLNRATYIEPPTSA